MIMYSPAVTTFCSGVVVRAPVVWALTLNCWIESMTSARWFMKACPSAVVQSIFSAM
jgi:hypothetical protein